MIFVKAGTYYEHVMVNRTVALVGEDVATTVVDGNGTGHVITVLRDGVNITGFTIQGSGNTHWPALESAITLNNVADCVVSSNYVADNGFCGISLLYSNRNAIIDNNVTRSEWGGIHLLTSSYNTVSRNIVDHVYAPINAHASSHFNTITRNVISHSTYGTFYHNARYNTIHGNNISHIAVAGIWLQEQVSYTAVTDNTIVNSTAAIRLQGPHQQNLVKRNVITDAEVGLQLQTSATYTIVTENTIRDNAYGALIESGSTTNTFYHNNFLNNTHHVNVTGISVSNWDNGCDGNYWDTYNGTDLDGNGIGDAPAIIDSYNADDYPLINPYWNPGDLNHDLAVDIFDATLLCVAYGADPSDLHWNCHCDIAAPYNVVDLFDAVLMAINYGETYNP